METFALEPAKTLTFVVMDIASQDQRIIVMITTLALLIGVTLRLRAVNIHGYPMAVTAPQMETFAMALRLVITDIVFLVRLCIATITLNALWTFVIDTKAANTSHSQELPVKTEITALARKSTPIYVTLGTANQELPNTAMTTTNAQ